MARKSRQLRLQQAQELAGLYEEAGFARTKKHRFITDMVARLERRDITGGQKKFLDSLIEQGAPVVKNQERVDEIKAAMEVDGMEHRRVGPDTPVGGARGRSSGGYGITKRVLRLIPEDTKRDETKTTTTGL